MNERTTLLLVEDDAAHVELIRRAFEEDKSDINLRVCATLKETRRMSQITPPDLFISDLNLPDGSGLELLASSNGDPQIPVILMTGFGNEDIAVEAMKSGAMDYIVKSEGAFSSMPKTVKRVLREWRYFSENKNINHVLQEVAKGIAAKKHETFFDALVRSLSASLLADKVFIGELVGESQEIGKSIAFWCDGQKGDYFEYPLEGSPCNLHTTQDICTFPSDLQTLFPDCALAKEMGIEAYIGVSIKDHQGIPIGILVALYNNKQKDLAISESVIQIYANIAAGELERQKYFKERMHTETVLQQSEERYRGIYDSSEVSIWNEDFSKVYQELNQLRQNGVIDLWQYLNKNKHLAWKLAAMVEVKQVNEATLALFHANTKDELSGSIDKTFGLGAIEVFIKELCAIWEGKKFFRSEANFKTLDGEMLTCILSMPLPKTEEGFRDVPVSLLDISIQKQAESKLRHSQKMDALGELTGGIAHDYNNMLGIVLGYAELLKGKLTKQPKLAKYAHEIHHAGERGVKLTKKLLAFSRRQSGDARKLNLNMLLRDQQHMLEKTLTARINVTLNLAEDLWPVWLDSGDLEDAIVNMSINSMHAMKMGGRLTLQTCNEAVNKMDAKLLQLDVGNFVVLSITDTGCGMDDKTKEKIFDPFFSTKGEQGTGLGLSQVYGFIERCGGAIKVYSKLEQGTRITLYLPRYYDSIGEDSPTETNQETPFEDRLGAEESILVVDDEPALRNLAFEILDQQNYHVIYAESAKQALQILENEPIDLLLSDVIMPEMDGYQLAAIVHRKYPAVKILLTSGFSDNRELDIVDENLQRNMLHKPYNAQTLLQRIGRLLG